MKIKLSEFETYELVMPDKDISLQEFIAFAERVNKIAKTFGKDDILNMMPKEIKERKKYTLHKKSKGSNPLNKNRELTIEALKVHYFGNEKKQEEFAEENNLNWKKIKMNIYSFRNKHKIKPKEVGLIEFPNKHTFGDFFANKEKWKIKN
jgi:hypothetical protein